MRTRLVALACAMALGIAACASPGDTGESAVRPTNPPPSTRPAPPPTPATLPPPSTLPSAVLPNPLTQQLIDSDMLALMPMQRLEAPLAGFVASVIVEESNTDAVDRLPPTYDEDEDHVTFGRENGYRSVLRPTRFNGTGTLAADTWVATFTTPLGASEYLVDYAKDLGKNGDAGRAPDLVTLEVRTFPVEEVGEEAAGFIIVAEEPATGETYQETMVAFRIGRLLAFASIFRDDDIDVRIPVLEIAGDFEERIVSVLDGSFEVVEVAPEAELAAYRFDYRQTLTQRYRYVVTPEGVDPGGDAGGGGGDAGGGDDDGGDDDGGDDDGGDTGEPEATVPVRWGSETDTTTVQTEGVVIGSDIQCAVRVSSPSTYVSRTYVVSGTKAWVSDGGRAYKEIDQYDEPWAADLVYCPGWSPDRTTSGVRSVTRPGTGELVPFGEDVAERFSLDRDDLVEIGLGGEDGSGITVQQFEILAAGEGPWVVDLALRLSGSTAAIERAVGPGFYPGANLTIDIEFSADSLNDPELSITIPG